MKKIYFYHLVGVLTNSLLAALPFGIFLGIVGGFWSLAWWQLDYAVRHNKLPDEYEGAFFSLANTLVSAIPAAYIGTLACFGLGSHPSSLDSWFEIGYLSEIKYTPIFRWVIFGLSLLVSVSMHLLGGRLAFALKVGKKPVLSQKLLARTPAHEWEYFLD